MKEIVPIEQTGIIKNGDNAGWQIRVIKDSDNTGGYLILISQDFSDPESEGFDSWVLSLDDLVKYFEESGWLVDWPNDPSEPATH